MSRRLILAVAGLLLSGSSAVTSVGCGAPKPPEPEPLTWTEPARVRLALLAHDRQAPQGQVVSVVLEPQGPKVVGPFDVPALPHPKEPGVFSVVAGHDGADAFAVARSESREGPWFVDVRDLGERVSWRSVAIPHAPPAALHLVDDRVLVGHGERLSTFVLAEGAPAVSELRHRPELRGKAYDLFARQGRYLIAIDDIRMPFYADSFDLAGAAPRHLAAFDLPGVVKGHYAYAALQAGPGLSGRLFAITRFSGIMGSGHALRAISFADGAPISREADPGAVVRLEEEIPRSPGVALSLLVGDAHTPWTGLAVVQGAGPGLVLIAAGARGLLSLPADFTSESGPATHDLGGEVVDVIAHQGRAWALRAEAERTSLLELDLGQAGEIGVTTTLVLEGVYRRFVR